MSIAENDAQIINPEMPDVPLHEPSEISNKINLHDYKQPSFDVETVDLDIRLFDDHAQVDSTLKMVRQTAGDHNRWLALLRLIEQQGQQF